MAEHLLIFLAQAVVHHKPLIMREELSERVKDALKLFLDEMYAGLKEYFEVLGWEVETVQDAGLSGAKDRDIVEYAKKHGLMLVTQDQKPAELAELLGVKYVLISNATIAKVADKEIREKFPSLKD
jgi:predicted nuclease of predicted toxin-antitoxin system